MGLAELTLLRWTAAGVRLDRTVTGPWEGGTKATGTFRRSREQETIVLTVLSVSSNKPKINTLCDCASLYIVPCGAKQSSWEGGNLYLSALSITTVALNKLPSSTGAHWWGWCILAGPRWPRLQPRDGAPPQTPGPYYSAIYITEYHSSKPTPRFIQSLQLRDTIRPVCSEGRVERGRQGHDNKLADGCGENKGHPQLDITAITISQDLSTVH